MMEKIKNIYCEKLCATSFITLLLIILYTNTLFSQGIVTVSTTQEFFNSIKNVAPGTTILFENGVYAFGQKIELTQQATKDNPIIIKAKNEGTVELTGDSWFLLKGASFITIEGFVFTSNNGPAVHLNGSNNCRVTNNHFKLKENKNGSWVLIDGAKSSHNRIDHNLFEEKSLLGNFVTIEGTMAPDFQSSQYDKIDNNYFRNIGPRAENVLEAIRSGSSHVSLSSGFTLIEKNLFERCDGDPEIVSIKTSDDTVRYNTFRECLGVLSLRHGNRSTVDGNFFFGNGRTGEFLDNTGKTWALGTGGVRFYGDNMKVINNYFEGLTGQKWDASLALTSGNTDYGLGDPLTKHYRARYTVVAFNTFVNNVSNIEVGYDGDGFQGNWWFKPPVEITIANNIVVGSNGELVKVFQEPINSTWLNNIVFPKGDNAATSRKFTEEEVRVLDPKLVQKDGLWRLAEDSPVRGKTVGWFPYLTRDVDGQLREKEKDPGADQVSNSIALNKPLTKNDVGPSWLRNK